MAYKWGMKLKTKGRLSRIVPLSISPELAEYAEVRWRALYPRISSRSHYLQVLIDLDRRRKILDDPKCSAEFQVLSLAA